MNSKTTYSQGAPGTASANDWQVGGSHYSLSAYQHWDYATDLKMRHVEGAATKYLARAGNKAGEPREKDLEKALHYLEKALELHMAGRLDALYEKQPGELEVGSIVARFIVASMRGAAFTARAVAALVLVSEWRNEADLKQVIELVKEELAYERSLPQAAPVKVGGAHAGQSIDQLK